MKEVKYPIEFKYDALGYKFIVICNERLGCGNSSKEAIDSLIKSMNSFTPYTWKCVEKPKPHLIKQ